ncbi:VanZ family protein [Endozoicomonas sp.]|uniref:VanZ family protein n=1 Tax=Endozoicomonas sp. TaxID=1892382 RepID=UPI002887A93A|nr:VanZ family protein [Endozoicomonas sp.]
MDEIIATLETVPSESWQIVFLSAMAFALFMALIPVNMDPTRFINDKVKHALTFMVLFLLVDLAFSTPDIAWWKPVGLMAFGVLIEMCQQLTRYRRFSIGDILANGVGIALYILIVIATGWRQLPALT